MQFAKFSGCGRFVVLEGLNLDRVVFEELDRWAREHGLRAQDAIQVAICAFNERCEVKLPHVSASRVRPPLSDRIE